VNWKSVLKRLRSSSALPPLPESFIFGVATSDHQCEAYKAEREDIRDVWERERGLTRRGKATNFEEHFEEDIRLAQKLGCTAFRFSVAWSRVEPSPGQFDDAMFDYYRRLVTAIHNAGMEPVLTLHHFTWPVHVEQRGGMIADDFPTMFAYYTAEVVARLGKEVRYWITFNEPSQLVYGYIKPWWEPNYFVPPGLPEGATLNEQVAAIGKLIRNLFVAHTEARKIIRRGNPDAQVGANPLLLGLPNFVEAGFRVASGAVGVNANQLYDYPLQLYHWGTNKTYESAVKAGNNPALMKMQDTLASAFFGDAVNSEKIIEGTKHTRISSEAI